MYFKNNRLNFYNKYLIFTLRNSMQDIEPFFRWRDQYISSEDPHSPFSKPNTGKCIIPMLSTITSYTLSGMIAETLFLKVIFVDYTDRYAIIEFIGEWNDAIQNDIMFVKRKVIEKLIDHGIIYFVLTLDNVLNFHGSDDCYYEEWYEEVSEEGGWITMLGVQEHIEDELVSTQK